MLVIHYMRAVGSGLTPLAVALVAFSLTSNASAETSAMASARPAEEAGDVCIERHRQAQVERREGHLLAAHEQLRSCLVPQCSPILREACAALLAELERDTPSVVLAADSQQGDLLNVTVDDAGRRIATKLDGVPISLDPGEHQLEFRAAGMAPSKETVVLRAGDKNRRIAVRLQPLTPKLTTRGAVPLEPVPKAQSPGRDRRWDYALIGAGSAIGIAGIWVGASAANDYRDAEDTCAPLCSDEQRDAIYTKSLVADGLFVLSLATLSYGVFRLLSTGSSPRATSVWLGPGSLSAQGRF
jgi:hypothetical protein